MGKKEILNPTFSLFPKKVTVFVSLKANPTPPPPFSKEVFDSNLHHLSSALPSRIGNLATSLPGSQILPPSWRCRGRETLETRIVI